MWRLSLFIIVSEFAALLFLISVFTLHENFSAVWLFSALLGGMIIVIPNAYFTAYAFRHYRHRNDINEDLMADRAQKVNRAFYQGEVGKFILVVVGFIAIYRLYPQVHNSILFGVFVVMQLLHIIVTTKAVKHFVR